MPFSFPRRVAGVAGYRTFLLMVGLCLALLALETLMAPALVGS